MDNVQSSLQADPEPLTPDINLTLPIPPLSSTGDEVVGEDGAGEGRAGGDPLRVVPGQEGAGGEDDAAAMQESYAATTPITGAAAYIGINASMRGQLLHSVFNSELRLPSFRSRSGVSMEGCSPLREDRGRQAYGGETMHVGTRQAFGEAMHVSDSEGGVRAPFAHFGLSMNSPVVSCWDLMVEPQEHPSTPYPEAAEGVGAGVIAKLPATGFGVSTQKEAPPSAVTSASIASQVIEQVIKAPVLEQPRARESVRHIPDDSEVDSHMNAVGRELEQTEGAAAGIHGGAATGRHHCTVASTCKEKILSRSNTHSAQGLITGPATLLPHTTLSRPVLSSASLCSRRTASDSQGLPRSTCITRRDDLIWVAHFFFSLYYSPALDPTPLPPAVPGVAHQPQLCLEEFVVQYDLENAYMWAMKLHPQNALKLMQLRSYMNGHSRFNEPVFPFNAHLGFVRSHRLQRKRYKGLSNPLCIHGVRKTPSSLVPSSMPHGLFSSPLSVFFSNVPLGDRLRWEELTGRPFGCGMPVEAEEYIEWRSTYPAAQVGAAGAGAGTGAGEGAGAGAGEGAGAGKCCSSSSDKASKDVQAPRCCEGRSTETPYALQGQSRRSDGSSSRCFPEWSAYHNGPSAGACVVPSLSEQPYRQTDCLHDKKPVTPNAPASFMQCFYKKEELSTSMVASKCIYT